MNCNKSYLSQPIIQYNLIGFNQDQTNEEMNRKMLQNLQQSNLQGFYKNLRISQVIRISPSKWIRHIVQVFSFIDIPIKGMPSNCKISYIFAILIQAMVQASRSPAFKPDQLRDRLQCIIKGTIKISSMINRERDNEITFQIRRKYFQIIDKYLLYIIVAVLEIDKKPQSLKNTVQSMKQKLDNLWKKKNELTFQYMLSMLDFFSKISLFLENNYLSPYKVCKKIKQGLIDALASQDRIPKWILLYNLVIWIQNRIVADAKGIITDIVIDTIIRLIDHVNKQLIPKLWLKNMEGQNLFYSMIKWNLYEQLYKIYEYFPRQVAKQFQLHLLMLVQMMLKNIPKLEMLKLEERKFQNSAFIVFYYKLCLFKHYLTHQNGILSPLSQNFVKKYQQEKTLIPQEDKIAVWIYELTQVEKNKQIQIRLMESLKQLFKVDRSKQDILKMKKFEIYFLFFYAITYNKLQVVRQFVNQLSPMDQFLLHKSLICNFHFFKSRYLFLVMENCLDAMKKLLQATVSSFAELDLLCLVIDLISICYSLFLGKDRSQKRLKTLFFCTHCQATRNLSICRICQSLCFILRCRKQSQCKELMKNYHKRFLQICQIMKEEEYLQKIQPQFIEDLLIILSRVHQYDLN